MNSVLNILMWIFLGTVLTTAAVYVLSVKGVILFRRCPNPEKTLPEFHYLTSRPWYFSKAKHLFCTYCRLKLCCGEEKPRMSVTLWVQQQPFCSYVCIGREYERRYNQ